MRLLGAYLHSERKENMRKKGSPTPLSATDLQRLSGKIIRRAYKGEHFIVERGGYPVVAIISIHEYTNLVQPHKKNSA